MPEFRRIEGEEAWDRAVPILRQLWSHRDEAFVRSWREEEDYRLFGRFVEADGGTAGDERLVAVAGVSAQTVLHHERGCWVHDLVVDEPHRGEGHGEALLADLEDWARQRDCAHLALACVSDNEDALAFYDAVGLERFGRVLETEL